MSEIKMYKNVEDFFQLLDYGFELLEHHNFYVIGVARDQLIFSLVQDEFIGGSFDSRLLAKDLNEKYALYKKFEFKGLDVDLTDLYSRLHDNLSEVSVPYSVILDLTTQLSIVLDKMGVEH